MKKLGIMICFVFVLTHKSLYAQPTAMQSIRKMVNTINQHVGSYHVKKKNIHGFSSEGGEVKYFYDKNHLVRINAVHYGEIGFNTEIWYFNNHHLIFAYIASNDYNRPSGKVIAENNSRYYFDHGKMIRWVNGTQQKKIGSTNFDEKSADLLSSVKQYIEISKLPYHCVSYNDEQFSSCDDEAS